MREPRIPALVVRAPTKMRAEADMLSDVLPKSMAVEVMVVNAEQEQTENSSQNSEKVQNIR